MLTEARRQGLRSLSISGTFHATDLMFVVAQMSSLRRYSEVLDRVIDQWAAEVHPDGDLEGVDSVALAQLTPEDWVSMLDEYFVQHVPQRYRRSHLFWLLVMAQTRFQYPRVVKFLQPNFRTAVPALSDPELTGLPFGDVQRVPVAEFLKLLPREQAEAFAVLLRHRQTGVDEGLMQALAALQNPDGKVPQSVPQLLKSYQP